MAMKRFGPGARAVLRMNTDGLTDPVAIPRPVSPELAAERDQIRARTLELDNKTVNKSDSIPISKGLVRRVEDSPATSVRRRVLQAAAFIGISCIGIYAILHDNYKIISTSDGYGVKSLPPLYEITTTHRVRMAISLLEGNLLTFESLSQRRLTKKEVDNILRTSIINRGFLESLADKDTKIQKPLFYRLIRSNEEKLIEDLYQRYTFVIIKLTSKGNRLKE